MKKYNKKLFIVEDVVSCKTEGQFVFVTNKHGDVALFSCKDYEVENVIIPYGKYHFIDCFGDGLARVESHDGKWGIINDKGKELVLCKYKSIKNFINEDGFVFCKETEVELNNGIIRRIHLDDLEGWTGVSYHKFLENKAQEEWERKSQETAFDDDDYRQWTLDAYENNPELMWNTD